MGGRTLTQLCSALLLLVVRVRGDGGIDPAALAGAVGVEVYDFDKKLNECNEETTFSCDDFFEMLKGYGQKMESAMSCIGYNKYQSPGEHLKAIGEMDSWNNGSRHQIDLTVKFNKIIELNTANHVMVIDFELYLFWLEPRFLSFKDEGAEDCETNQTVNAYLELDSDTGRHLWLPPIELWSMVEMTTKNSFRAGHGLRAYPSALIENYGRYEAKVDCDMNFAYFPFDVHECPFKLYLTRGDMNVTLLSWSDDFPFLKVTDIEQLNVPDWTLDLEMGDDYTHFSPYYGETTTGVAAVFKFKRVYTIHLMHTFFPSVMIALSSVLSVYVPSDLVPGRMGLCITAFLSMISLFNGARKDWPLTSYMKAIDMWTTGCYFVVFTALIEYCIVLYLVKRADWERKIMKHKRTEAAKSSKKVAFLEKIEQRNKPDKVFDAHGELIRRKEVAAAKIELSARILLPTFFGVLNLIFWISVSV